MIEDLFDHKCNVFHANTTVESRGYGLPGTKKVTYPDTPDISELSCHFGVKTGTITVIQQEPQKDLDARLKLSLPAGTDVRIGDKIVDCDTGFEYMAEIPRNIRNHHIIVWINRTYPKAL